MDGSAFLRWKQGMYGAGCGRWGLSGGTVEFHGGVAESPFMTYTDGVNHH